MTSTSTQIIKAKPKLSTQPNNIATFNTAECGKLLFGSDMKSATGSMEMIVFSYNFLFTSSL